jgi:Nif-specific regulatory protein
MAASDARESRRLSTLLDVSSALSGTLNLRSALHKVLEILTKHHGYIRSLVTMLHDNGELHIEAVRSSCRASARSRRS